jgi:hypothetical protein
VLLTCWFSPETGAIEKEKSMNSAYISRYYKGFLLQQTDKGWIIVNAPTRTPSGPLSPGPYSTDGIAAHVVDRIIQDSERR